MWCILYIAIAGTAPPTDCSISRRSTCLLMAQQVNDTQWSDNLEEIRYLSLCILSSDRAKYRQANLVSKVAD